jgi:WD40 repeat protein/DNA-binding SARP family transcriptional activator
VDFRILGPLEAWSDQRRLPLGGSKQRMLLAVLLLHRNEVVSIDRLVEELWDGRPPATAVKALQVHVSQLRKVLGAGQAASDTESGDVLVTQAPGYLLRVGPDELDAVRFERLVEEGRRVLGAGSPRLATRTLLEALALWRGPALADFVHESFAQQEIRRLEEVHLSALASRIDADLALGRHEELVGELEALVAENPLRERLRGQLMLALYRTGRQADALEVYRQTRELMQSELGLEPSRALQELERSILLQDAGLEPTAHPFVATPAADDAVVVCPFKGLAFFDVGDADYFYGREQIVGDLVSRLADGPFVGIVGPSGGGKSSIVRAGLVSALARGALPGSAGWRVLLIRPGEHPCAELARVLGTASLDEAVTSLQPGERILLVVDQLEEVFTACQDAGERTAFLDALVETAADPNRRAGVVVALRADFYGRCGEYQRFGQLLSTSHVLIGPMEPGDVGRAIELPANRANLEIDRPLVDALVADVAGEPGGLPLLSTALLELWRRRDGRRLSYDAYRSSGGVRGAVARLAEQAYARLDAQEKETARAIMLRLCSGEAGAVVRRRVPLAELDADRNDQVAQVLAILTDARLLTTSDSTVEVAHEALLREWPRLQSWLDEDVEGRRMHLHLAAASREWDSRGRDPAELYRGARLSAALDWSSRHATELTRVEREFVAASRAESGRQLRRLRILLTGVAVLLLVAVAAGIGALVLRRHAQNTARVEKSRALATVSQAQLGVDPERSILLAAAAVREAPTPDAVFALRRALDDSPLLARMPSVGQQTVNFWGPSLSYSSDGTRLAEGSQDGNVRIFEAASGRLLRSVHIGGQAPIVQYSPDGSALAVGGSRGVRIVDPRTGLTKLVAAIRPYGACGYLCDVNQLAFSPDGSVLYIADGTNTVRWNIRTNRARLLTPRGGLAGGALSGGTYYVAVSPDGRRLALGGQPGIAVVDATSGKVLAANPSIPSMWEIAFSPDGRTIAAAESPPYPSFTVAGTIGLFDSGTLRPRRTLARLDGDTFSAISFSPDGRALAFGTDLGSSGIYDVASGERLVSFPGHTTNIWQVEFSPDGKDVATSAGDGKALVWRASGNERRAIATDGFDTGTNAIFPADLQFLRNRIVTRFAPRTGPAVGHEVVESWTLGGRRAAAPLVLGPADNFFARLSGNGGFALAGATQPYGTSMKRAQIWNLRTRRVEHTVRISSGANLPILSPDGTWLAFADDTFRTVEIENRAAGRERRLRTSVCTSVYFDFSADDRLVAANSFCGRVHVWSTATGARIGHELRFVGSQALGPERLSHDGSILAVANSGNLGQITLVRVATGRTVAVLTEHTLVIQDLAFSPDDHLLAAASLDGTARIWDAHTGRPLRVLEHPDGVENVAFSPDGRSVATLDFAGVIRIWDACNDCTDARALMALARSRVTRQLTDDERRTFGVN